MTMKDTERSMSEEDADLSALMRAAGSRARPAAAAAAEVRAAVAREWRESVVARRRRRTVTAWAVAASVAVAGLALWTARPLYLPAHGPLASLARLEGSVEYQARPGAAWTSATPSLNVKPGGSLRTGDTGRAALTLANGLDVRLDAGTELAFVDTGHAELTQGAVYVDSGAGAEAGSRELEIATPLGDLRHLGTQYQARVGDAVLQVAVREGRVSVGARGVSTVAAAGEQVRVTTDSVTRSPLPAHSAQWQWINAVTPPFAIEGKSVADFLSWAARETGRSVDYASPEVAREAGGIVLRGSVTGLTPDQAVRAVLSTTPLRPEILGDRIHIEGSSL